MKSVASSVKSFKCDCCAYVTSQSNNLSRHKKAKHAENLKKSADEISDISESEEQPILNKDCHFCINYKQLLEMKDNRIFELERQIELLQKDLQIEVLQTKLECKDVVVDVSNNFIEKLSNIIQSQQSIPQSQPKGRPRKLETIDETSDLPILPTIVSTPVLPPKPLKKKALTKEELKIQDYQEEMKSISENIKKMPVSMPTKSKKPREIDINYLNEICGNAEPFEKLIEDVFKNTQYFEMCNLTEEQLKDHKIKKNDYYVSKMLKFQDHLISPSRSKKSLLPYQINMEGKKKFYNSLLIEAFEKQEVKPFYYVKKTKQSFYKDTDSWKICDNEYLEKTLKRFEERIFTIGSNSRKLLMIGKIPSSAYGFKELNYEILNSKQPLYEMPSNEKEFLEDLMNQWSLGLMESCNNERMSDILFKQLKMCFDPKASHNSNVCTKYDKVTELCEDVAAKSDDEEE